MPKNQLSKNIDRYGVDTSWDLDPLRVQNIFQSANGGSVRRQSRLAYELIEKEPAIAQAWNVRVSAIASCPWEIVGPNIQESVNIEQKLKSITPSYDSGLVSFNRLLQNMQSANMHGFSLAQTAWSKAGSDIDGFKLYSPSLFSYVQSDLPYFIGTDETSTTNKKRVYPNYPNWIYHTSTTSRDSEPLRSGLVRPLAYIYSFQRHVKIAYLRGLERYGLPQPFVGVDGVLYDDDNSEKDKVISMLENWTYDGYSLFDKDSMTVTFPTADSGFDVNNFLSFLEWQEKQMFRMILGQDSTSSADNSNRSTAQVHNLVRQDILASDAKAVEETVNTQIIKPLYEQTYNSGNAPVFRFRLKGVAEIQEMAKVIVDLDKAGYEVPQAILAERFGFPVLRKEDSTEVVTNGND